MVSSINSVRLDHAVDQLLSEQPDTLERRHLERFQPLPDIRPSQLKDLFPRTSLNDALLDELMPRMADKNVLRGQAFAMTLNGILTKLGQAQNGQEDSVLRLTELVLKREQHLQALLRKNLSALIEA